MVTYNVVTKNTRDALHKVYLWGTIITRILPAKMMRSHRSLDFLCHRCYLHPITYTRPRAASCPNFGSLASRNQDLSTSFKEGMSLPQNVSTEDGTLDMSNDNHETTHTSMMNRVQQHVLSTQPYARRISHVARVNTQSKTLWIAVSQCILILIDNMRINEHETHQ